MYNLNLSISRALPFQFKFWSIAFSGEGGRLQKLLQMLWLFWFINFQDSATNHYIIQVMKRIPTLPFRVRGQRTKKVSSRLGFCCSLPPLMFLQNIAVRFLLYIGCSRKIRHWTFTNHVGIHILLGRTTSKRWRFRFYSKSRHREPGGRQKHRGVGSLQTKKHQAELYLELCFSLENT